MRTLVLAQHWKGSDSELTTEQIMKKYMSMSLGTFMSRKMDPCESKCYVCHGGHGCGKSIEHMTVNCSMMSYVSTSNASAEIPELVRKWQMLQIASLFLLLPEGLRKIVLEYSFISFRFFGQYTPPQIRYVPTRRVYSPTSRSKKRDMARRRVIARKDVNHRLNAFKSGVEPYDFTVCSSQELGDDYCTDHHTDYYTDEEY